MYVEHLGTGETATHNANQVFRAASLYKLFVLFAAFSRIEARELNREEALTLSQKAVDLDQYTEWPAGTRTSVDCALHAMITVSNNAAAEMLTH